MLRRLFDGLVLIILVWFVIARLDAGEVVLGLGLAVVIAFTGWRVHRLWRKYQRLLAELAAAEALKLSDDPDEQQRGERMLRSRRLMHAADMSLVTGFVLGAAASDAPMASGGGEMAGGVDGMGGDGVGGGDMGAGGFGGDVGGGM
jgi:hypothetical protein